MINALPRRNNRLLLISFVLMAAAGLTPSRLADTMPQILASVSAAVKAAKPAGDTVCHCANCLGGVHCCCRASGHCTN